MKQYEPIPVKPMRLRGVFGIAWNLYKRGFWGTFFYCLLFSGVILLLSSWLNNGSIANLMEFSRGIEYGNNTFYYSFAGAGGLIALIFLLSLVNAMVLQPILQGGIYTELSCHMYGTVGGFGDMMRRCGHMLKRFFSTQMTLWLVTIGFSVAFAILMLIVATVAVFGMIPALMFSGGELSTGMIVTLILAALLLVLLFFAAMLFLSFIYPVAVNEGIYNFKALGRSFRLTAKRFWRVLGTNLLVSVILAVVIFALTVGYEFLPQNQPWSAALYTLAVILAEMFYLPYQYSLTTALYFDACARFPAEPLRQEADARPDEKPDKSGNMEPPEASPSELEPEKAEDDGRQTEET